MHYLNEIASKIVLTCLLMAAAEQMILSSPEKDGLIPWLPAPEIETLQPQCFNKDITLRNNPVGYPDVQRVWEYGIFGDQWQAVGEPFTAFLANVDSYLKELYPIGIHCETCDPGKISNAISGADYHFMNQSYRLYADLSNNKAELANQLVQGIEDQYLGYLSDAERAYLSSFFAPAACQVSGWVPPYFPTVSQWYSLGTVSSDEITISASSITPERSGIVTLAFRVKLESGPYSRVQLTDIKPKPPSFTAVSVNSCPNNPTGVISLTNISGLLPSKNYMCVLKRAGDEAGTKYYFSGTEYAFSEKFSSGSYIINLYYNDPVSGGCSINGAVEVGLHPELQFNASATRASCPEIADGSITASIITYAGSYNFRLNGIDFTNSGGTFTSLDNGSYMLEVTDICNTSPKTRILTISEPSGVSITSVIASDPACLSSPDGAISVNVSGGENPYSYQLVDGSYGVLRSFSNIGTECSFNSLPGGTYRIMARSGNCAWKTSEIKSLRTVNPVSFTTAVTDVDCFGKNTGKINVTASGGNSSFLYSINNQPYAGTSSFESLASATYYIKVQSTATSCNDIADRNVSVGTASKIGISFTGQKSPSCFEMDDGSITANVTGGTGSYLYSWELRSGGAWYPEPGSSNVLSGLYAGSYRLNIRDTKNCTDSKETLITDPPELIVQSATPSDVACFGGMGSIMVTASGGTGSYTYSHLENSGFQPSSQINIPAGDYYIYVKDANGCKAVYEDLITVTGPDSPLDFTYASTSYNGFSIACAGDASGTVTIEASGGNGLKYDGTEFQGYVYSVAESADQPSPSFSGLHAGTHNIKVTDGRGCPVLKTVTLTQPDPLSLNLVSSSPVRCFGAATGEIVVSASGGIENTYTYRLDGAEILSPGIFKDLYADTYEIEVSDLNGCRQTLFAAVHSLNPPIDIIASGKDVRCFGEGNGEINTTVSGGAGGFSYQWEKNTGAEWLTLGGTSGSTTSLGPGIYRVKVTDSEECFQYENIEISEPSLLQITGVTASDIVCFGEKGSIAINASGGTSGFTYYCSAANGDKFESSQPGLQLPAGSYSAGIKDANGCIAGHPSLLVITEPASPLGFTATLSSYHGYPVSCNGKSDGQITVEATGGNSAGYSGYTYSLLSGPGQPENNFNGLAAGSYSVKVADARGCSLQKNFTLTQPDQVSMNLQRVAPVKCYGEPTGEIEVLTTGGVQDYTYKLNGAPASPSGLFKDLTAGSYIVEVIDLNSCSYALPATIDHENPPISTLLTPLAVRCYGESDGEIKAELSGGSGGFTSYWEKKSEAGWDPFQSDGANIGNLKAGVYRLRAVDSDNCTALAVAEVKEPEPLLISNVTIEDAVCYGDQGTLGIEATGGNPGYVFQNTPNNNRVVYYDYTPGEPVSPGIYGLKVTDSKGCIAEGSGIYHVTSPPSPLSLEFRLSEFGEYNVSCHGNNDGRLEVVALGGNGSGYTGYTYYLEGRQPQGVSYFSGLEAGTYEITITDGRGCSLTKTAILDQPESSIVLKASSLKNPVCFYDTTGSITLAARGGALPYVYSINGGTYSQSAEFTDLSVNKYSFRVRDLNGCAESFDTLLQSVVSEMNISADITNVKCFGETSGSVNVSVSGGAKPFTYHWKENAISTSLNTNLATGKYTVVVKDSAGCISEKQFLVSQPEMPLNLFLTATYACEGLKDGEITVFPRGGTPPYRYDVDQKSDFPLSPVFKVYAGDHVVYLADSNGCLAEKRVTVSLRNTMPDINFMLATSRYELDTLVVIDVSVPPPDRVTWEFSADAAVIDTGKNKAYVRYNQAGLFPVKMTGLFGACAYTIEKLLNIAPFDPAVISTDRNKTGIKSLKISPNPNDGSFELLVELYTKQQLTVAVYDIYSKIVFHKKLPADILFVEGVNLPGTLMPGTYILRVTAENDSRTALFVISE